MGLAWQGDKIMKKFFACMVALMAMSTTFVYADQHSAMLEQGDSIALFYGADALQQAYAVADSGAVITLSKGKFAGLTIEKSLTLVGYYGFSTDPAIGTVINGDVTITANNVTFDGMRVMGNIKLGNISDCTIRHSGIQAILAIDNIRLHTNTIVDQCFVNYGGDDFYSVDFRGCKDFVIKNSTIRLNNVDANANSNPIYFTNNVIYMIMGRHTGCDDYMLPYAIYKNNVIMYPSSGRQNIDGNWTVLSQKYASTYLNNAWSRYQYSNKSYNLERYYGTLASVVDDTQVHQDSIFSSIDPYEDGSKLPFPAYPINPGLGSDGTPRGPLGGTGFTDRPSIPRITGRDIDLNPDAGGKLNVKITVSAE